MRQWHSKFACHLRLDPPFVLRNHSQAKHKRRSLFFLFQAHDFSLEQNTFDVFLQQFRPLTKAPIINPMAAEVTVTSY